MGKVITFGTLKGGTGKSTSVFSTAGILAERGYRVLIIDVDPQANITSNLGIDETLDGYVGVKELFEDEKLDVNRAIIKAPIKELPTLDIIGSTIALTSTEMRIISFAGREFLLKKYIKRNREVFDKYDYILVDTNPSMSIINQNSFVVSNGIVLVSDIGVNSLRGLEVFIALWEDILDRLDMENNIKGILVNKYNDRSTMSQEFIEYCKEDEDIKKLMFNTCIPSSIRLPECELERLPINLIDKRSISYIAFNAFVDELISRL